VAMFGPTDGKLFTRHHPKVILVEPEEPFPCSPCWRNEDLPCKLVKQLGPSPCISAVSFARVRAAVELALDSRH